MKLVPSRKSPDMRVAPNVQLPKQPGSSQSHLELVVEDNVQLSECSEKIYPSRSFTIFEPSINTSLARRLFGLHAAVLICEFFYKRVGILLAFILISLIFELTAGFLAPHTILDISAKNCFLSAFSVFTSRPQCP